MTDLAVAMARSLRRHLVPALVGVVAATGVLAAPAQAADRERPRGPQKIERIDRVAPEFFGIDMTIGPQGPAAWPAFDLGAVRVATSWRAVERKRGTYDWAELDVKVSSVEEHGATPLLVLEGTPSFHATDSPATYGSPPRLGAFRRFVRALVARYGARADYQVWNEGNVPNFFLGTPAQLAAMTKVVGKAADSLAPGATVAAPSFLLRNPATTRQWFRDFWSQRVGRKPVGKFVDVAAISGYPMPDEAPEDAIALSGFARRVLDKSGFAGPLWVVEINYGASGLEPTVAPIPMQRQAAYVVRTYALQANAGVERVYWWRWENHQTVNTSVNDGAGGLTGAGDAFARVQSWILGTRPVGCKVRKGVTTCSFKVGQGVTRHISWSRSGRTRKAFTPEGATTRTTIGGVSRTVKPLRKMRVGLSPVMVESQIQPGDGTRNTQR